MKNSWPLGVTTQSDMERYAKTLFPNGTIENLMPGLPLEWQKAGCLFIRVKGACNEGDWKIWPGLIGAAMKATVATYGRPYVIQVKSRRSGASRARQYDTLQVTPNGCTCRVYFGADKHHKHQTRAS